MNTTVLKLWSAFSPVRACAVAALIAILSQYTLAGLALFVSASFWSAHIGVGFFVALPLAALLALTRRQAPQAELARPVRWLTATYVVQVLLAAAADGPGASVLRALHVGNSALVLLAVCRLVAHALKSRTSTAASFNLTTPLEIRS